MRFLADMGVSMKTVEALRRGDHDVVHLRDEGFHRLPDGEILSKAQREGRVILTFDLDFGDLLAAGLKSFPSVVIFRLRNPTPPSVTPRLLEVLSEMGSSIEAGRVVIIEEGRYRVRSLPMEPQSPEPGPRA